MSVAALARVAASSNVWARRVFALADAARTRCTRVVFESRDGGSRFTVFGGYRTGYHLAPWYFGPSVSVRARVELHAAISAEQCRRLAAAEGLVVFCGTSVPAALEPDVLHIPTFVDLERPTPTVFEGPGSGWGGVAKENVRRIKRGGFTWDVVAPGALQRTFYDEMFARTMTVRHGHRGFVNSRRDLKRFGDTPGAEMLRVLRDGRCAAAILNRRDGRAYRLYVLGWPDGAPSGLRDGAVAALYWFSFQRAATLSCDRILLGGSFPCLSEGVLRHKVYWGARLSAPSPERGSLALLVDPTHPAARQMLQQHTLIAHGRHGEWVAVGGGTGRHPASASALLRDKPHYVLRESPQDPPPGSMSGLPPALARWLGPAT